VKVLDVVVFWPNRLVPKAVMCMTPYDAR
jgi:hypothetical protein